MKIEIPNEILKLWKSKGAKWPKIEDMLRWGGTGKHSIGLEQITETDFTLLKTILREERSSVICTQMHRRMTTFENLKDNTESVKIGRLDQLATALKNYIEPTQHKWLFGNEADDSMCPYFVEQIIYLPRNRHEEAHTTLRMSYMQRGSKVMQSVTWYRQDFTRNARTVSQFLSDVGYTLENKELLETYEASLKRYNEITTQTGEQYSAYGMAQLSSSYYQTGLSSMEIEGEASRVVIDDQTEDGGNKRGTDSQVVSALFWMLKGKDEDEDLDDSEEEDEKKDLFIAPIHPYLKVFDLKKHHHASIHVDYLKLYQWAENLDNKLVLDEEKKELISMLVTSAGEVLDDIVKGKTGGVIVMATGEPGTGKTLTAEVYSETIKRSLYAVQCSQLGIDMESIEKNLMLVLTRATRWKAILLIDEADVYIHERGNNVNQNAIVGVFLRVLEYYRGILFMTSNRATVIDDAIVSRFTAHVRYFNPEPAEAKKIWKIQSTQQQINLDPNLTEELLKEFPKISGRNIRNLLKLTRMVMVKKKCQVSFDLIKRVAKFQDLHGNVDKQKL